ncbi:MAG: RagB/SusD family nutrient uptake outer membrane protein [Bacteroidetes bacterium]|nr:RagB/SusD family nutrient uptake outer membrane protein [Bacteroidota bacterium]
MNSISLKIKTSLFFAVFTASLLLAGCEGYLDKAPEASVREEDAWKDFISFQGFTEGIYLYLTDVAVILYSSDYNLADETRMNVTFMLGEAMDAGNYWGWQTAYGSYSRQLGLPTPNDLRLNGNFYSSWKGIRKANLGLANLDKLVNATQEEKDLIEGQLRFFRGYFYFILMKDWGGLPYIDIPLAADDEMRYERLNYQQTALKAAADLEAAAQLLPVNWDGTEAGRRTQGNNRERINKITALSALGKDLLYAASPLMNRESTGDAGYNVELCKKAADVFGQVIRLCDQTGFYQLQPWKSYSDLFYTCSPEKIQPGGVEDILCAPVSQNTPAVYHGMLTWGTTYLGQVAQTSSVTANYVKYWGMKNGLPIDDPASGYDPANPWKNREPRFYKTIIVDGDQLCTTTKAGPDRFAQLYTGGRHRNPRGCVTGFLSNKYFGLTQNKFDGGGFQNRYIMRVPHIRLADVYLMYAEAVLHGYGTPQSSAPGNITAVDAVNRVRNRAQLPDIDPKFTGSKEVFMEELIRERAVELAFENLRWNDLRRWLLNGDPRYLDKTELLFDRDPATGRPINMQERVLKTRVVQEKHNWLPFPVEYVSIYPGFQQNPGW